MPDQDKIDVHNFLEKWTLIVGDVNTGKTTLTQRILDRLVHLVPDERLAVIDLAPVIPQQMAVQLGLSGVGGRLSRPEEVNALYLSTHIDPPRLSTDTEEAALAVAERNRAKIEKLLYTFAESGRDVLVVNDISLYLQAGSVRDLTRYFSKTATLVANGYLGQKLGQGVLSQREHREMQALMGSFTKVLRL